MASAAPWPWLGLLAVMIGWHILLVGATKRPIWGIITEPNQGAFPKLPPDGSFVNADYVRWIESAGARVVPVFYNQSEEELDIIFSSINGLLFPGGNDVINHTLYYNASSYLIRRALEANSRGDYFPIHGTCLGLELLAAVVNDDSNLQLLSPMDAENISLPLTFVDAPENSRLLSLLSHKQLVELATRPLTENQHHWGVTVDTWMRSKPLQNFFKLITVSRDRNGLPFISTIEAYDYPITAVQWHPERSLYEWNADEDIDHSLRAVEIMQLVADYLVQQSKRSTHTFGSPAVEAQYLINQYPTAYNGKSGHGTLEVYFFEQQR